MADEDAANTWLNQWATDHHSDRHFVYVVKPTAPKDPGLAEFYAI